jgi:hypothetical protein
LKTIGITLPISLLRLTTIVSRKIHTQGNGTKYAHIGGRNWILSYSAAVVENLVGESMKKLHVASMAEAVAKAINQKALAAK